MVGSDVFVDLFFLCKKDTELLQPASFQIVVFQGNDDKMPWIME